MTAKWKTAWVTGASTGIGRELTLRLAEQGVRVAASARSVEKLRELANENKNILAAPLDVSVRANVATVHAEIAQQFGEIDLAVLNAGVWDPMIADDYDAGRAMHTMDVNYGGIVNALHPLLTRMIARGTGHIALVASVAGYRGLPKSIAYAPSKAAIINLAEVLKLDLTRHGIVVSLINPGFVDTPMTSVYTFPMPFMLTPQDAVTRILLGLQRERFEIAFPFRLALLLKLLRVLPYSIYFPLVRKSKGGG